MFHPKINNMKKIVFVLLISGIIPIALHAQKYITKTGHVTFYSYAPIENITAKNDQVSAALDITSGEFVFKVLMKSFEFAKNKMQDDFNEDYVESDKYPNASFTGKVINVKDINIAKNDSVIVQVEGDLTIHGVTKKMTTSGTIGVKDGVLTGYSKFTILLKDYNISVPNTVVNNISKTIEITVNIVLNKLNK
jgi:polyisoprenoid-binding protein YceI